MHATGLSGFFSPDKSDLRKFCFDYALGVYADSMRSFNLSNVIMQGCGGGEEGRLFEILEERV